MSDLLPFIRAWVTDPRKVSAISPSSPALARLITSEVTAQRTPVLELGPGTGVFTQALLDRGINQNDLTLIEAGPDFSRLLSKRYPKARILQMDACRLGRHGLFGRGELASAISGLPLLSMTPRQIMGILSGSFEYLREDGAFYQFTYGPRCPVPAAILARLDLQATRIGTTVRNVPPSSVYKIERKRRPEVISEVRKSA
ncbi:rRNA adenine N-6-methyltransferase family protein [Thalassospira sp.]|uniref:class I SAM-dependent methyltransferase n=1 Tax=Thalassospira sp. TaxID=1912094 RepID=UPI001B04A783|nr:rRNA adenine N-6-methyltransferase family protein [Thalassospira sp.]MBO6806615.1 SAM-dependent methyltransferase [Thalassospira sp.]MBO6838864.1 SAM-dependent methyltransferase [Thalassospira sp.]